MSPKWPSSGCPTSVGAGSATRGWSDRQLSPEALDEHCRKSGLANFKRPRRYVFVKDIPKSPVGKLLRRNLVAGQYVGEETITTAA